MKAEVKRQKWGEDTMVILRGENRQATIEAYYWFWHYGIAELELDNDRMVWHSDNVVQFFTTKDKFIHGMAISRIFKLLNENQGERFKGLKGGAMSEAREWAIDFWDNIEHTSGYRAKRGRYHYNDYDNNHGKAENLSDIDA